MTPELNINNKNRPIKVMCEAEYPVQEKQHTGGNTLSVGTEEDQKVETSLPGGRE